GSWRRGWGCPRPAASCASKCLMAYGGASRAPRRGRCSSPGWWNRSLARGTNLQAPSAADHHLDSSSVPSTIVLSALLGHPRFAKDSTHVRVLEVSGYPDQSIDTILEAAQHEIADVSDIEVLVGIRAHGLLVIAVRADTGGDVRNEIGLASQAKAISAAGFNRRDRRGQGNAEPERLVVEAERPLSGLAEPRDAELAEQTPTRHHLGAAAVEKADRRSEDPLERRLG